MNEKEIVEVLTTIKENLDNDEWFTQAKSYLEEIIEWHQRRIAIKELMDNPPDPWHPANSPYMLKLAGFYADDAALELQMYMRMDGFKLPMLHSAIKQARFAKMYYDKARELESP